MNAQLLPPHERHLLLRIAKNHNLLSPQELTTIEHWAYGTGMRITARQMNIKISTVRTYRERALEKLDAFINTDQTT